MTHPGRGRCRAWPTRAAALVFAQLDPATTLILTDRDTRALYRVSAELVAAGDGTRRGLLLLEPARAAHELETLLHFGLTAREADVVLGVLRGEKSARIAGRLGISAHTVEHHLRHVFAKVGVGSRPALAARLMGVLEGLHHAGAEPRQGGFEPRYREPLS